MKTTPNNQLPDEIVKFIEEAANDYVEKTRGREGRVETYIAGATEYATKLHQAREVVKVLEYDNKQLKGELEGYKEAHDDQKSLVRDIDNIITGGMPSKQASLCDLVSPIRKLHAKHNAAVDLLEKFKSRHEAGLLPDMFIYNKIKQFLDGKQSNGASNKMEE